MQNRTKPRKGIMQWAAATAPGRRAAATRKDERYRKAATGTVDPGGLNIRPKRKV